jgi:hypothetical protein
VVFQAQSQAWDSQQVMAVSQAMAAVSQVLQVTQVMQVTLVMAESLVLMDSMAIQAWEWDMAMEDSQWEAAVAAVNIITKMTKQLEGNLFAFQLLCCCLFSCQGVELVVNNAKRFPTVLDIG